MSRQEDFREMSKDLHVQFLSNPWTIYETGCEYGYQYAQTHPNWISVEDELPKEQGKYMFRLSNGDMYYETYYPKLKLLDNVTHWMEIQPPRKEE